MKIVGLRQLENLVRKIRNFLTQKDREIIFLKNKLQRYDMYYSVGEACLTANYLKEYKLRKMSGPFDWLYGSSFLNRIQLIIDEFENYLLKDDLVYIGKRDFPEPMNIYENIKTKIIFNHDFPINQSLENSYDGVLKKYNRRIERFLNSLRDKKKILLVYMTLPDSESNPKNDFEIVTVIEQLNRKYSSQIDLLYIEHNENYLEDEIYQKRLSSNVIKIIMFNRDKNKNENYTGNKENLSQVLSKFGV